MKGKRGNSTRGTANGGGGRAFELSVLGVKDEVVGQRKRRSRSERQ